MVSMSGDLDDELEAIRSIYGDNIVQRSASNVYVLRLSEYDASLRISFPLDYPDASPSILGTEAIGEHVRKGYGKQIVDEARQTLQEVFHTGSVCLFDLLQELETRLQRLAPQVQQKEDLAPAPSPPTSHLEPLLAEEPAWFLSAPTTEKKSTFIARACSVTSPAQAHACVAHLLATEKRVSKATHNITAYRIRSSATSQSSRDLSYQDCDDDGETAAGGRLLHLLQVMDIWNILVVVSRWYGGVKLGPDRFSVINNVAREVILEGGWRKSRIPKD